MLLYFAVFGPALTTRLLIPVLLCQGFACWCSALTCAVAWLLSIANTPLIVNYPSSQLQHPRKLAVVDETVLVRVHLVHEIIDVEIQPTTTRTHVGYTHSFIRWRSVRRTSVLPKDVVDDVLQSGLFDVPALVVFASHRNERRH